MIQTLTKSMGILALILTLAFSVSAQSKNINTKANGQKDGSPNSARTQLSFNASNNEVRIKCTSSTDGGVSFVRAAIAKVSSSGGYKPITTYFPLGSTKRFYPKSYGFTGVCSLIVTDWDNKHHTITFTVN